MHSSVGNEEKDTRKISTMDRCADYNKKKQERKTRRMKEKETDQSGKEGSPQ